MALPGGSAITLVWSYEPLRVNGLPTSAPQLSAREFCRSRE